MPVWLLDWETYVPYTVHDISQQPMRKPQNEGKGLFTEKMQKSLLGCILLERHPDYDNDKTAVLKWGN